MSTPTRNPDLDPVKVKGIKITHTASCNRVSRVGIQVRVILRNGERVDCEHDSGHRTKNALDTCATRLVARLNRLAGTSSAEVEASKRRAA